MMGAGHRVIGAAQFTLSTAGGLAYKPGVFEPFPATIDASTRCCAVLGHPVRHSASPAMQNAGLAALGLNWRYLAVDVRPEELREVLEGARRMNFIGLNLTVPHKLIAFGLMDVLDDSTRPWETVNTVRFEGRDAAGEWRPAGDLPEPASEVRAHGFNTDADAIIRALKEDLGFEPRSQRVLLLGAGGAGRTAALRLAMAGLSELFLVNRTQEKAEAVAVEIGRLFPQVVVSTGYPRGKVDLVLNATSLGLRPDDSLPWDHRRFVLKQANAAYDMIYRPALTPFLSQAKEAGCRTANGVGMLLYQGVKALELWTGKAAPVGVMRAALEKAVYG